MFRGCWFNGGFPMFGGSGIMMLIILIPIGFMIYMMMNKNYSKNTSSKSNGIDKLTEKFLNNEITKEEYEEKLQVIKKNI